MSQALNDILVSNSPGVSGTLVMPDATVFSASLVVLPNTANLGVAPFPVYASTALVGNVTASAGQGGVLTISGSAGALTITLPLAASAVGGEYIFRTLSADAHVLTGTQESAGTKVICLALPSATSSVVTAGSKYTFAATKGSSIVLKCDGLSFILMGGSGSLAGTISGT